MFEEDNIKAATRIVMMYGEYIYYRQESQGDETAFDEIYAEATALACAALINGAGEDIQCPICGSHDVECVGADEDEDDSTSGTTGGGGGYVTHIRRTD